MSMSRVLRSCFIPLLGAAFATPVAIAQNLLVNPSFDTDASGWSLVDIPNFTTSYRADVGSTLPGGSGPGALQISDRFFGAGWSGSRQEVAVQAGREYRMEASVLVPSGSTVSVVLLAAEFYDQSGSPLGTESVRGTFTVGAWTTISGTITAPALAARANFAVGEFPSSNLAETQPSIAIYDDAFFGPAAGATITQVLFVPAAAAAHGVAPTYWSTTAWVANLTDATVTLAGSLLRQGQDNSAAVAEPTILGTVAPHGFLQVTDVVTALGGDGVTAGLALTATAQGGDLPSTLVEVTTHTFTPNPAGLGTFGQGIPAVPAGTASQTVVPGVFQSSAFRTNIGALNCSPVSISVLVRIVNAAGVVAASATWALQPYEQKQVSLPSLGVSSLDGGTATFTLTTSGSFRGYASTIDQSSGDAVYNEAR